MIDPLIALTAATAFLVGAVVLLRPGRGLLWRWLRASRASEKVLLEDALKHLFDFEYKNRQATLESLTGVLPISPGRVVEILSQLEEHELVVAHEGGYRLTSEGRHYALRVVRIHRLWESYLSDETGLGPSQWHDEAEQLEHTTSIEEAEEMAARMGHPQWDPHGDPIPSAGGEIEPPQGRQLTTLPEGEIAEIVHVEDEPAAIYAQLLAEGLHPGMRVRVNKVTPQRIRFEAEAEEHILAPVLAANLWVEPLPREVEMPGPYERMSDLNPGDEATVITLSPALRGPERRRMFDLGLVPGTRVRAELRSPAGDPTGYRIRGAVIALRRDQADGVQIERHSEAASP